MKVLSIHNLITPRKPRSTFLLLGYNIHSNILVTLLIGLLLKIFFLPGDCHSMWPFKYIHLSAVWIIALFEVVLKQYIYTYISFI